MAELVRVKMADGSEATISRSAAERHGLKVLDKPAADSRGRAYLAKYPVTLKGDGLDRALDAAGLSKSGKAEEKRARLAEYEEGQNRLSDPNTGSQPTQSEEG